MFEFSLIDELEGRILDPHVEDQVRAADVYYLLPTLSKAYIALLKREKIAPLYIAEAIVKLVNINLVNLNDEGSKIENWAMNVAQKIVSEGVETFILIIEDFGINPEILYSYISSPVYAGEKEDHAVILGLKKPFSPKSIFSAWAKEYEEFLLEEIKLQQEFLGNILDICQFGIDLNTLIGRFISEIKGSYYSSYLWNKVGSDFETFTKTLYDITFRTLNNILKREGESPLFWFSKDKEVWYIHRDLYKEVAEKAPRLLKFHKDYLEKFKK